MGTKRYESLEIVLKVFYGGALKPEEPEGGNQYVEHFGRSSICRCSCFEMGILLKDDRKERLSCEEGRLIADIQKQNSNSLIIKNSKQIHFLDSGSVFAFCVSCFFYI